VVARRSQADVGECVRLPTSAEAVLAVWVGVELQDLRLWVLKRRWRLVLLEADLFLVWGETLLLVVDLTHFVP
jgi:hypothetical protein